jgi:hypothetical protein
MKPDLSRHNIILLWLGWAVMMAGYLNYVQARFQLARPDYALSWTPSETRVDSQNTMPYLLEPFMNAQVAWDSEYYLSIAVAGYQDPTMRAIPKTYTWSKPQVALQRDQPEWISMNYAFFPFYPLLIRLLAYPLSLLGMNPVATATLAGVLISLFGTLGAMFALYDLARDGDDEASSWRAAFYLLIFPSALFLSVVYTEGLFLGLSFGALALARRKRWVWAALLAACATWTRAAGGLLLLPFGWYWLQSGGMKNLSGPSGWREAGKLVLLASPLWAYLIFNFSLGANFHIIESRFYSRGLLLIQQSSAAWQASWESIVNGNVQAQAYYLVEFGAIFLGVATCLWLLRREPALALYGLLAIGFALTSGVAQGMHRYVLAAPALFLVPARWGKSAAFDRVWTIGNVLLLGVFATMFSFNFWAG